MTPSNMNNLSVAQETEAIHHRKIPLPTAYRHPWPPTCSSHSLVPATRKVILHVLKGERVEFSALLSS
jgi:hypothetical protein